MTEYIEVLAKTKLFSGIAPDEIAGLLTCLHARRAHYAKDELIIEEGSCVSAFGVILCGHARSIKWDASGRLLLITLLQKESELGVMLAARQNQKSPVSVQAQDDVSVFMIPYQYLVTHCPKSCPEHEKLLRNYIAIVAEKGLILHERMHCLLQPTLREKIMAYLLRVSRERQSSVLEIPLNRYAMAEYLNTERSALSRELSSMKRDGLIDYHKNIFRLL